MDLLSRFPRLAYIFDKDGTLLDTETVWYEAYTRLLAPFGVTHDMQTQLRMLGASAQDCIRILQERHSVLPRGPHISAALRSERLLYFREVRDERGVRPMSGAERFLQICGVYDIRLALATSANRMDTIAELKLLGWEDLFEVIVTGDDVENPKPAPDAYLLAAERLGVAPGECLAFEDGEKGVQSAHAAGIPVVFIRDQRFQVPPPPEAALVIESFSELL